MVAGAAAVARAVARGQRRLRVAPHGVAVRRDVRVGRDVVRDGLGEVVPHGVALVDLGGGLLGGRGRRLGRRVAREAEGLGDGGGDGRRPSWLPPELRGRRELDELLGDAGHARHGVVAVLREAHLVVVLRRRAAPLAPLAAAARAERDQALRRRLHEVHEQRGHDLVEAHVHGVAIMLNGHGRRVLRGARVVVRLRHREHGDLHELAPPVRLHAELAGPHLDERRPRGHGHAHRGLGLFAQAHAVVLVAAVGRDRQPRLVAVRDDDEARPLDDVRRRRAVRAVERLRVDGFDRHLVLRRGVAGPPLLAVLGQLLALREF